MYNQVVAVKHIDAQFMRITVRSNIDAALGVPRTFSLIRSLVLLHSRVESLKNISQRK